VSRVRSSDKPTPPKRQHAPTRGDQKQALIDALERAPTQELTVREVANLQPPIPGVDRGDLNQATIVISEYLYDHPRTVRHDLVPGGTIRVVCLHPTSRKDRRWRE
jgi:hypothetical protein